MNIKKIREALEAAANLTELNPNNYGSDDVWDCIQQVRDVLPLADEALAELDKMQQGSEPVAWCVAYDGPGPNGGRRIHSNPTMHKPDAEALSRRTGLALVELYAHQPQVQQPGKVLTDEEIEKLRLSREREDGRRASSKYGYGFADGLRYARDNGYIAPSARMTDERPWMNEWQRNMCKKSKASLINIIEEERDENDRLRNLAPSAGLTVDEAEECLESLIEDGDDHAKERQRKLLCEMMKDDAKSGLYDTGERPPLLSDEDVKRIALGYFTPEYVQKSRVAQDLYNASYVAIHKALEICEAARAKDAELIQRLVDALKVLVFLEFCNEEGLSSGAPTSKDWKRAFDKAQEQIDAAAEAGFKPTEP